MGVTSEKKLIVGLGNPGESYEYTRHNLGFLVVRSLAEKLHLKFKPCSFAKALIAQSKGTDTSLLMPLTFMNDSGAAVKAAVDKQEIALQDILVICDDSSLPFGQIRLRAKGSDGGHNGLSSVIYHLASENFARLRLGIDAPPPNKDLAEYVLGEFTRKEKGLLDDFIEEAAGCALLWLKGEVNQAMENYNRRKENGKK